MIRPQLQLISPEPQALGWYVTPGWSDHEVLREYVAQGGLLTGIVVIPALEERQRELRAAALERDIEVVLDPHVLEQAFDGGNSRGSIRGIHAVTSSIPERRRCLG